MLKCTEWKCKNYRVYRFIFSNIFSYLPYISIDFFHFLFKTFLFSSGDFDLNLNIISHLLSRYLSVLYNNFSFFPDGTSTFCKTSDIMSLMRWLMWPKTSSLISYKETRLITKNNASERRIYVISHKIVSYRFKLLIDGSWIPSRILNWVISFW